MTQPFPSTIDPVHREAFDSWLERLAAQLSCSVPDLLSAAEISLSFSGGPTVFGLTLEDDHKLSLANLTRLDPAAMSGLTLDRFKGAVDLAEFDPKQPKTLRPTLQAAWFSLSRSRACIDCLLSDGFAWQGSWRLAFHAICLRHETVLAEHCVSCNLPFRSTKGPLPYRAGVPAIDRCLNLARDGKRSHRCLAPYAADGRAPARAALTEIEAQHRVLDALKGTRTRAFGERLNSTSRLVLLRHVMTLVSRTGNLDDLATVSDRSVKAFATHWLHRTLPELGCTPVSWTAPPAGVDLAVALLTTAVDLMRDPNLDRLASLIDRSVASDFDSHRRVWVPSLRGEPDWWADLWPAHVDCRRPPKLWTSGGLSVPARQLPARLPPEQAAVFDELIPGTMSDKVAVFGAVAVARFGTGSWAQAWDSLGYPPERHQSWIEVPLRRSRLAGHETAFAAAAHHLAITAEKWCTVDYSSSRDRHAGLVEFEELHVRRYLRQLGIRHSREKLLSKYLAMHVWVTLTGGDFRFSPAFVAAERRGVRRDSLREGFRRCARLLGKHPDLLFALWQDAEQAAGNHTGELAASKSDSHFSPAQVDGSPSTRAAQ